MSKRDRVTLLVAAMLTGNNSPGDDLINQCILLAGVIARQIEEKHGDTNAHQ